MPGPFLSYLRVYEPLRAFEGPSGIAVRAALARGALSPESAGRRERELCLRAQLRSRLLPPPVVEVLVTEGQSGPLVCPLDMRARAGAAVLEFLASEEPFLRAAALPVAESAARRGAERAVAELAGGPVHVLSASWTVPLPWFALVDPDRRQLRQDPRRVWWQVPIGPARRRAARAREVVSAGLGESGPAEVLGEIATWLEHFDRDSVVELDYGGLVDLVDGAALRSDPSAAQVEEALLALGDGDAEGAQLRYERLRVFWSAVADKRRSG